VILLFACRKSSCTVLTSSPLAFSKVPKEWRKVCQTLFNGTVAKVASLIAIVIGGYGFAHGEPGAKK